MAIATRRFDADVARDIIAALPDLLKLAKGQHSTVALLVASMPTTVNHPVDYVLEMASNLSPARPATKPTRISQDAKRQVDEVKTELFDRPAAELAKSRQAAADTARLRSEAMDEERFRKACAERLQYFWERSVIYGKPNQHSVQQCVREMEDAGRRLCLADEQMATRRTWFDDVVAPWLVEKDQNAKSWEAESTKYAAHRAGADRSKTTFAARMKTAHAAIYAPRTDDGTEASELTAELLA